MPRAMSNPECERLIRPLGLDAECQHNEGCALHERSAPINGVEGRSSAEIIRNLYALAFDCLCFAKAIQHDIAAGCGKPCAMPRPLVDPVTIAAFP
jgi:hypothetical protein